MVDAYCICPLICYAGLTACLFWNLIAVTAAWIKVSSKFGVSQMFATLWESYVDLIHAKKILNVILFFLQM